VAGEGQGDERKRTIDEVSKAKGRRQNRGHCELQDKSRESLLTARAAPGIKVA
jgi:hypothetical protein